MTFTLNDIRLTNVHFKRKKENPEDEYKYKRIQTHYNKEIFLKVYTIIVQKLH